MGNFISKTFFVFLCCTSIAVQGATLIRHTVIVDGHSMALWEKSPENPKAQILLLHGRTWSALPDFDLQVEGEDLSFMDGLNAFGYSVFALDARGYGKTPRDDTGWLTPSKSASDAVGVLEWIKQQSGLPLHLYGWSYGAMVSQLVVQKFPDLVETVILFGYPFDPLRHVAPRDAVYPNEPPAMPNTAKNAASDFITPGSTSQKAIDTYVKVALAADRVRVDFRDLHEWGTLDATHITTPTLLLEGEFDPLAPAANLATFFTKISTANKWWVVLPGGDHAALLETPRQKMLQTIDAFIESSRIRH
jgi:pimeloyl-ACP methyl ester carboxylesterase